MLQKYAVKCGRIPNLNMFERPYTNIYQYKKGVAICLADQPDFKAIWTFLNQASEPKTVFVSTRLLNILDIKDRVMLERIDDSTFFYKTSITLEKYKPFSMLPAEGKVKKSDVVEVSELKITSALTFELPEDIIKKYRGPLLIDIITDGSKYIKIKKARGVNPNQISAKECRSEFGRELERYPYENISFVEKSYKSFHVFTSFLKKLEWHNASDFVLYESDAALYIARKPEKDLFTGELINPLFRSASYGYIAGETKQYFKK